MTEAAVSFAGNLTDDPEVRSTEGGIARAMLRVAVSNRREQEPSFFTVVVRPSTPRSRSRRQPRGSHGPALAVGMDGRGRQRPLGHGGRGRGAGPEPSLATATPGRAARDPYRRLATLGISLG
jgi:Single-strand binding protein family